MTEEIENLDSSNEEKDVINLDEFEDINALKEKFPKIIDFGKHQELTGKNKQLFERAKKAEGFEKIDGKWIKPEPKSEKKPETTLRPEPNEPDYAKLAFLKSEGISNPDDQKWVQDEASRLKLPLTDILGMAHAKSYLETAKTQRDAVAGMPKEGGRAGGKIQDDVAYHLANNTTPEDLELAEKVIDARSKQDTSQRMFNPPRVEEKA